MTNSNVRCRQFVSQGNPASVLFPTPHNNAVPSTNKRKEKQIKRKSQNIALKIHATIESYRHTTSEGSIEKSACDVCVLPRLLCVFISASSLKGVNFADLPSIGEAQFSLSKYNTFHRKVKRPTPKATNLHNLRQ